MSAPRIDGDSPPGLDAQVASRGRCSGEITRVLAGDRRLASLAVLVVDDHEDTRTMFAEYLAWHGARPIPVPSVAEAVSVLEAMVVDAVVTDLAMPCEDGYALLARLDANPMWAAIPRVIASGQSSPGEASERVTHAVYLGKPVALDELVRAVHSACASIDGTDDVVFLGAGDAT
ncbi:MAG: response regulator [Myxococcota bacterium]|nr:response regulator [Myxococcota bacterium]